MNTATAPPQSLAKLLDGIAGAAARRIGHRSHAGRPRRAARQRIPRVARQRRARPQVRAAGRRQRRARGVVGAGAGSRDPRPAVGDPGRARAAPARTCEHDRGSLLRRAFVAAGGGRHHRHQRQDHLRLSTGAGARSRRQARGLHGHHRHRSPATAHRERTDHGRRGYRAAHAGTVARAKAPRTWRWRSPRMRSTRRASAPCDSAPRCSPTSRAIISTITARWTATARPRRGCSRAKTWCRA